MASRVDDEELFYYACLWPHVTGLPMRVWVPDMAAKDEYLRVQTSHTAESRPNEVALVSLSSEPRIFEGNLPEDDASAVTAFVARNLDALRAHRNGECDSGELVYRLRR